jgi:Calcineurin-like phosphoesterase
MSKGTTAVIVPPHRVDEKLTRFLTMGSAKITEAAKRPRADGLEAAGEPVTDEEVATFLRELPVALQQLQAGRPDVILVPDDRFCSLLQSFLAENSMKIGKVDAVADGLEAKFDEHDVLGWAGSLITWVRKLKPHKWQIPPSAPDAVPDTMRVGLLGDWGSGLYGAPVCVDSIKKDAKGYNVLIHLGDVYYSGTRAEVTDRFLGLWPSVAAVNRACNSNHEMYTGGYAYFGLTLKQFGQPSSCFALQNANWLLVGLDSAYEEASLANNQVAWLTRLIENAGDRRVILFTHHQLFSWADPVKDTLVRQLETLLTNRRLFAWYWGHEHRCVVYDPHSAWGIRGRCIGHSGYPYFRDSFLEGTVSARGVQDTTWRKVDGRKGVPGASVLDGPNPYVANHALEYGPHGYMTLEFNGDRLNEIIHLPDGTVVYEHEAS